VQHALHDISFDVKEGEFFGIVGRNGSGKSTLLKMLAGIYQPTQGNVHVAGRLVPFIELGVGFNPELTGRENVYLNGALLNFSEREIDAMYNDIVEFAELENFMDQKLKNYSSGMQVRLAFSMAIRADAEVLLVDEVLAVGDADFQRKCFSYFKTLKKNKKTVVFVTHDMNAVREYCDRAMLIDRSKLVAIGSAKHIATEYTKLFTQDAAEGGVAKETAKRWGDGTAKLGKPKVTVDQNSISVDFDLQASSGGIEDSIVGFAIKDAQGLSIVATNTLLIENRKIEIPALQTAQITFKLANFLKDGKYTLDIAVIYDDGITVRDWWDDATKFTVAKETDVPSLTNPTVELSVK
jgi:ABC-2 type transport system ATP-binding protein